MGARRLSYNTLYCIRSYKETTGGGNSYTTQFRQYDPRLGRWKSLDPLAGKFPNMSPFVAFNNNPIYFVDPLGLEGEEPGDGDKNKKENGFWKKRDKNGNLTNKDADTRQLPEVTVNVPISDKEKEEINARRRIKSIPSIQFENKLTKAQQKILLDRFNRMAARSGVWSKGTKDLYDAIYNGRDSYTKYFNYNPVFGESFAYYWNQGAKAWDKESIGYQLQIFAVITLGGTMTATIVAPASVEIFALNPVGGFLAVNNIVLQIAEKGIQNVDWSTPFFLFVTPNGLGGVVVGGLLDGAIDFSIYEGVKLLTDKGIKLFLWDSVNGVIYGIPTLSYSGSTITFWMFVTETSLYIPMNLPKHHPSFNAFIKK